MNVTVSLSLSGVYGSSDVWVWLILAAVYVGRWLGRCVWVNVQERMVHRAFLSWGVILIIELYEFCVSSYYEFKCFLFLFFNFLLFFVVGFIDFFLITSL